MNSIRREIIDIKLRMEKTFFNEQLEKIREKAKIRENNIKPIWIGLDKVELPIYPEHYRYLPNYYLEFFFSEISEIFEVYFNEDAQLSEKIRILRLLLRDSNKFNINLQKNEDLLFFSINQDTQKMSDDFDNLVNSCIKSQIEEYIRFKPIIDDYIEKINPENQSELIIKVNFWPSVFKIFKNN